MRVKVVLIIKGRAALNK